MKHYDTILSYEEACREIDLFGGEVSEEMKQYKSQVAYILENSDESQSRIFLQSLQAVKTTLDNTWKYWEFSWPQRWSIGKYVRYQKELSILKEVNEEFLWRHASRFLDELVMIIEATLKSRKLRSPQNILSSGIAKITAENFWKQLWEVESEYGSTWVIIFLRECMIQWKVLEKIQEYSAEKKASNTSETYEYWEYRNLEKLAMTKIRIQESQDEGGKYPSVNIALSGGNMNGLAHIWVIEGILESGKNISCISWSSIGALIWVIVAINLDPWKSPTENLNRWREIQEYFTGWFMNITLAWSVLKEGERLELKKFFIKLASEFGIFRETKFSELKVPVIINGARDSRQWQQVYMWSDDEVIKSIFASLNVYGKYFWDTIIDDSRVQDHAAGKQLNAVEALKILGEYGENSYLVDTGSGSSDRDRTGLPERLIRTAFPATSRRDIMERLIVRYRWGWNVIAPDVRSIFWGKTLNIGFSTNPSITKQLIYTWKKAVTNTLGSS